MMNVNMEAKDHLELRNKRYEQKEEKIFILCHFVDHLVKIEIID